MSEEEHVGAHPLHVWVLFDKFMILELWVQSGSGITSVYDHAFIPIEAYRMRCEISGRILR